jgi:uncharacterized membrane protein
MLGKTLICLVFMLSISLAATVYGTIYEWSTLEPLNDCIIEVNSTPVQQLISKDGNYSFHLPIGSYEITAKYYENNSLLLESTDNVSVVSDGNYLMDIIMFPAIDLGEPLFNETDPNLEEQYLFTNQDNWLNIAFFSIALTAVILVLASKIMTRKKEEPEETLAKKPAKLSKEERQVLEIIQREHRLTQKELRKKLPWSEAKVSLIVADLEERSLIKKIKKGRGNILKTS